MIDWKRLRSARRELVLLIIALAVVFGVYRVLHATDLNRSALLFIGLPTILAIAVAVSPPAKTTIGIAFRGITIALLLSGILFIEGTICILIAAPIFYLVGLFVALIIDWARRRADRSKRGWPSLLLLPVVMLSLEGTGPATTLNRQESVSVERILPATPDQVESALAAIPQFDDELPLFFRLGFPRPGATSGSGLAVDDERIVTFPMKAGTGSLEFRVVEARPGLVRFRLSSDTTPYHYWIGFDESLVRWSDADSATRVSWTLKYQRRLDPAWYFGPIERYATQRAADYLIRTLATPEASNG